MRITFRFPVVHAAFYKTGARALEFGFYWLDYFITVSGSEDSEECSVFSVCAEKEESHVSVWFHWIEDLDPSYKIFH